jgi:hypothetical protein
LVTLRPGQRYGRVRGFRLADKSGWADPQDAVTAAKWWVMWASRTESAPAHGREVIEIVEVVETETVGLLALYRQWLIDPDGHAVDSAWVKPRRKDLLFRAEVTLRGTMSRMGFKREGASLRVVA